MVFRLLSLALICVCCSGGVGYAQSTVNFRDYAVPITFFGKSAPPMHNTSNSRYYRTKIREAVAAGPNFADHYTIAVWGCGTSCVMFSIVDISNGRVYDFPFSVSYDDEDPCGVIFHRDSRVVRVIGRLNEVGDSKDRRYLWDGKNLVEKSEQPSCHSDRQNCGKKKPRPADR